LGAASAKKIAQILKMDSGDVYRRLESLYEKGFAEKILGNPNEYKSTPLKDAIKALIKPKNKEYAEMQKKVKLLLKKRINPVEMRDEKYTFSIVPKNESRRQYINRANERVQKEWLVYSQIERWPIAMSGYYATNKKCLDRGVRYRVILELDKPTDRALSFIEEYKKENPNYFVRFTDTNLLVSFGIYDKKEMNFSTEEIKGLANSQVLVTDNPHLVKLVSDYFELRWKTAMNEYPQRREKLNSIVY
jgi:sugar-specific transcriptional regulator TrmB